jgi:serine/threonine protein kinase
MAPEVIQSTPCNTEALELMDDEEAKKGYDHHCDVWSLGNTKAHPKKYDKLTNKYINAEAHVFSCSRMVKPIYFNSLKKVRSQSLVYISRSSPSVFVFRFERCSFVNLIILVH